MLVESKAQAVRRDEVSRLLNVCSNNLPQGGVEKVGASVVLSQKLATCEVNRRSDFLARLDIPRRDRAPMTHSIEARTLACATALEQCKRDRALLPAPRCQSCCSRLRDGVACALRAASTSALPLTNRLASFGRRGRSD